MKKIGIFGGTFDPPHIVHLSAAKIALRWLSLDELWFILSGNPPHKALEGITDLEIRLQMLSTFLQIDERFQIKDYEFDQTNVHYTIDTLNQIHQTHPNDNLYLILGSDSYNQIYTWKKPDEIVRISTLVVFLRPNAPIQKELKIKFPFIKLPVIPLNISSTRIRKRVKKGLPIDVYVPNQVETIIQTYNLYRND
ncbi:MAG: nicotinate-nucleotide adenylyltransferase [bacterium]|nr:nicotinate-nucleotide adenylyltransferase [bacterium]